MKNYFINHKKIISISFFIIVISLLGVFSIFASSDELDFVYASNHYNGASYSSSFIPPKTDSIYLLGNTTNILSARYTNVYYWALTNEYKASWDERNEIAKGTLEILENGKIIQAYERTQYALQYDANHMFETIELTVGKDAIEAIENFEAVQLKYREDLHVFNALFLAYEEELYAVLKEAREKGLAVSEDDFPTEPISPLDMTLFSTDLLNGYAINLPVGNYQVQFRLEDGTIQENSKKPLVIFEAIEDGIGYNVFSEERWTVEEITADTSETIYTIKEQSLFLQPYNQKLYNELYYIRMNNPQDKTSRLDKTIWMPFLNLDDSKIQIEYSSNSIIMEEQDFYVHQKQGYSLGYEIMEYDSELMDNISFSAHRIDTEDNINSYQVFTMDEEGNKIPKSERNIRVLNTDRSWVIYAVSFFPIVIGGIVVFIRRKKFVDEKITG